MSNYKILPFTIAALTAALLSSFFSQQVVGKYSLSAKPGEAFSGADSILKSDIPIFNFAGDTCIANDTLFIGIKHTSQSLSNTDSKFKINIIVTDDNIDKKILWDTSWMYSINNSYAASLKLLISEAGFIKCTSKTSIILSSGEEKLIDEQLEVIGMNLHKTNEGSSISTPADWEEFWMTVKKEVLFTNAAPIFKLHKETATHYIFDVSFTGTKNRIIKAWYTRPKIEQKYPAALFLPGYRSTVKAYIEKNVAILSLDVYGHGRSRNESSPSFPGFFTHGLQDKSTYSYTYALQDVIQAVTILKNLPEISDVSVIGISQGGYLAAGLAGIDNRITTAYCVMPPFADYKNYFKKAVWPGTEFLTFKDTFSISENIFWKNLSYFDGVNFVKKAECPMHFYVGMKDDITPPYLAWMLYKNAKSTQSTIKFYPKKSHNIGLYDGAIQSFLTDNKAEMN